MTTLKGIFPELKPVRRKNFIHENVKNLHRMKNCMSMNKGMKETRKSQVQSQKKINNNYIHNYNHTKDVSPKPNINLQGKQYESCHTKGTANHKLDQQKGLCKKSSVAILNKTTTNKKKSMYLTNNTIPIKQKKEVCKESNRCNRKLQRKVLSDSNLSNTSVSDTNKNVKIQTAVRNQSIQTLDITEIDNLYSEGIIKYPSKKCLNFDESVNKNERDEKIDKPLRNVINLSADEGDTQIIEKVVQNKNDLKSPKRDCSKEETDYIKLNKERSSIIDKVVTPIKNNTSNNINTNNCKHKNNNTPANYRVGVVPKYDIKYIKNRKEALEKEQKAKIDELDPNCPSGHVPLLDHERKETLRVLRKKYQDYVNELNMLPIKADTLRAQRRKIEIEKQLNNLEEGIKVFSRPKVYVKMNA